MVPLKGASELLKSLPPDKGAIVTSCSKPLAEVRLKAAGLPIPARILTSDDVVNGKPDPEPYRKGAALLGVPASKCVVFEDAPAGIRAGKSAGAIVVALRTTSPDAELEEAGADWIITGYSSLKFTNPNHGSGFIKLTLNG